MELQFEKKPCGFLRYCVSQVREQEQTQEIRLPDGMPDIGAILGAWGQCVIRGKEWDGDSVGVSGGVMARVLYTAADTGDAHVVEVWLPVHIKCNKPQSAKNGQIRCLWQIKGLDGRVLSARKMMVRANVSALMQAVEHCEEMLSQPPQPPEDVQLLVRSYPMQMHMEAGEKSFMLDEQLDLPRELPKPENIVSCTVMPQVNEQQVMGSKAVIRGVCPVRMLYMDADGKLCSYDTGFPFSQIAELDREFGEDASLGTMMAVSGLETELIDGAVRLKCGLIAQYMVDQRVMVELVEDAYSPYRQVNVQLQQLQLPAVLDLQQEQVSFECGIDEKAMTVADVTLYPQHPAVRRAGDLTEMVCGGQVQVLYYDENGMLRGRSGRWSREWELPVSESAEVYGLLWGCSGAVAMIHADQVRVTGELSVQTCTLARQGMPMVTGLEMGDKTLPDPARASLILRRGDGMSLWTLAKENGSTMEAIRKANNLSGELTDERMLLIPVS